ncbi:hypothetical protein PR048_002771 [Dryococelus australis]|uniref:Uncharacterized protein n=1 Tax=Dryococelus australis TaxID=614101 RepID=A0ABQ9IL33_9NEOP|nr:hypothetical protein PR048_002771 [Dryococelus australis]
MVCTRTALRNFGNTARRSGPGRSQAAAVNANTHARSPRNTCTLGTAWQGSKLAWRRQGSPRQHAISGTPRGRRTGPGVLRGRCTRKQYRASWRSANTLDTHSGGPGFDSRPDFGFPWFYEVTPGKCWDGSLTNVMTDSFHPSPAPPLQSATCNVSNDLADDETDCPSQHTLGVISRNPGDPKSGWPERKSNPSPPECVCSGNLAPPRSVARAFVLTMLASRTLSGIIGCRAQRGYSKVLRERLGTCDSSSQTHTWINLRIPSPVLLLVVCSPYSSSFCRFLQFSAGPSGTNPKQVFSQLMSLNRVMDFPPGVCAVVAAAIIRAGCHSSEKARIVRIHDSALAHSALLVQQFLAKPKIPQVRHPPYFPDLAPCYYFLFPIIVPQFKGTFQNTARLPPGRTGFNPNRDTPGFLLVGIVLDDDAGQRLPMENSMVPCGFSQPKVKLRCTFTAKCKLLLGCIAQGLPSSRVRCQLQVFETAGRHYKITRHQDQSVTTAAYVQRDNEYVQTNKYITEERLAAVVGISDCNLQKYSIAQDSSSLKTRVFIKFQSLVHVAFGTSWRRLAQSSPSTVRADNQCAVHIGIFVHKTVVSSPQIIELANFSETHVRSTVSGLHLESDSFQLRIVTGEKTEPWSGNTQDILPPIKANE